MTYDIITKPNDVMKGEEGPNHISLLQIPTSQRQELNVAQIMTQLRLLNDKVPFCVPLLNI